MKMIRMVAGAATGALMACNLTVVSAESNFADSGVVCSALPADAGGIDRTSPAGSGSVSEPQTFTVASAYQGRQELISDGGQSAREWWFGLYSQPVSCAAFRARDGGDNWLAEHSPMVGGSLGNPGHDNLSPGVYQVGTGRDGGWASLVAVLNTAEDGGLQLVDARAGSVTITSVEACALSGSFDATLRLYDGGTAAVRGAFSAAYCQ